MVDTNTTNLKLVDQTTGANENTWGDIVDANWAKIDAKFGGYLALSGITGGDTALTETQERINAIKVTGTLVSNATLTFSGRGGTWIIWNATTGAYSLTALVSGQTGVVVPQGSTYILYSNGTDIVQAGAINLANLALTGVPTAPTAAAGTNTTQLATTAFVTGAISTIKGSASAGYDTLGEIETAIGLRAPIASPTFTGTPAGPTAAANTNTTQLATTAYVQGELADRVPTSTTVNGHALSANVTVSKSDVGLGNVDNTADTAKPVSTAQQTALNLKANLASPTFTGTPAAPTAAANTNTTQLATTAYVQTELAALTPTDLDANVSAAEYGYLNGVTSAIQTQLNAKAPAASPTFTGTPAAPTAGAGTNTTQVATTAFVTAAVAAVGGGGYSIIATASGTVTIPTGMTTLMVTLVGAGGGGGGSTGTTSNGGDGGLGAGLKKRLTGLTPGHTLALVIGAKGVGGAAGAHDGTAGGNTTLASGTETITTLTAGGGGGGLETTGVCGAGGTATNGNINISPMVIASIAGQLVTSVFGLGFASTHTQSGSAADGIAGVGYGAPGGGGHRAALAGNSAGGDGTPGLAILEWSP